MDPQSLIDATRFPAVPAPFWFIQFFKVLGFTLHAVPMNLWYAGVVLAMVLRAAGPEHGKRFAGRLMAQMPVVVAYGVNLGIVPLLFVQVAYFKVFYPATILTAWFWFAIVVLLIPAYYGVYAYAWGLRDGGRGMTPRKRVGGWLAAVLFVALGLLFANGFSLMTNVEAWPDLWWSTNVGGAALGTATNAGDPSLWPRWLMMFGLALTTTAAWVVVDAAWFGRSESPEYQRWAPEFAWKLYTAGLAWFAVAGTWYVLGTWSADVWNVMVRGPLIVLTVLTAVAPGLPWLPLYRARRSETGPSRPAASLIGLAQFGVLGINAVSRQIVQNVELLPHLDVAGQRTEVQWSPMAMFLLTFVAGLGLIAWMIGRVVAASGGTTVQD